MDNFFHFNKFSRTVLFCTTSAFLLNCLPVPAYHAECKAININLNDIGFAVRMQNLIDKFNRYKDRLESGKLIEVLLDIKTEVENYTGKKIDLGSEFNRIEKEVNQRGVKFKPNDLRQIKNLIHRKEKRHAHRAVYMSTCFEYDIPYNSQEEKLVYLAMSVKKDKEEEKKHEEMPLRVTIGVTAALCGYLLSFIPHPWCQAASIALRGAGVSMCVEGIVTRMEKDQEEEKAKK